MHGTQSCVVRRTLYMSEKSLKNGQNRLKCGVLHTDLAVVGRKSGPPKITNDDICTISRSYGVVSVTC